MSTNNSHIHISLDLETMSTESDAAIVQIGATVVGSPETFNVYIDPKSSESIGAHVDAGTMQWWNKQDPELCPDWENITEELGDLLFYIQGMANILGIPLQVLIDQNMNKLTKRYPQGYTDQAAIARADKETLS